MLKYFFIVIAIALVVHAIILASRKIHTVRRMASKILDAYLPDDELAAYAKQLASHLNVSDYGNGLDLIENMLHSDYDYITMVYRELIEKSGDDGRMPPAAEWILDNYYIVERHIKEIRMGLDKKNFSKLPVIAEGQYKGYPRIYVIAEKLIAHRDARIEEDVLARFIQSYQEIDKLVSLELWALPVMLKLVLIENIAYICRKIRHSVKEYEYATKYCGYVMSKIEDDKWVKEKIDRYFANSSRINNSFASQLISNLKSRGAKAIYPLSILDANLERRGYNASLITDAEHRKQASRQIAMGNSIMGIVTLSAMDWANMFETLSEIEHLLRSDPGGVYSNMDAASRDMYRKRIKDIAKAADVSERAVVMRAIELANAADKDSMPKRHVGYYLICDGQPALYQRLSAKQQPEKKKRNSVKYYITGVWLGTAIICVFIFLLCLPLGILSALLLAIACVIPASEIAIKIINNRICAYKKVHVLPKLELEDGIPDEYATFVITPTLLFDEKNVSELVQNLESFYLANRSENLFFGIVGDFKDGDSASKDGETQIIAFANAKIDELNKKYTPHKRAFYLFCRKRRYNENEKRWMGRERKRGAICDFVSLIRNGEKGDFINLHNDVFSLPKIKYVITLDADTSLHQHTAMQLVGAMAHPLNRAVIDNATGTVTYGYGIMQPRVDVDIESANKTFFTKVFAGQGGIDQYSNAVSDVYQDLFGEGIFTGKGIFDVDAFYSTLHTAIPDNRILSHDLLEGSYLRCALLTDVEVSDGYPARYIAHMSRLHRWVRGDWQLLPWLFKTVPAPERKNTANPLNLLSRWKITDNLRRSVLPIFLFILILAGIFIPAPQRWWVLGLVGVALGFSLITSLMGAVGSGYFNFIRQRSNATIIYGVKGVFFEFLLLLITLPYNAFLMTDAILRTLYRVNVSHKNMLEWVTAADAEKRSKNDVLSYYKKMWFCVLAAFCILLPAVLYGDNTIFVLACIFGACWIFAPLIGFVISREERQQKYQFSQTEVHTLRILSRQTWRYFEDFASASDNYLPPDNVQMDPPNGVAHRTSPTNIGMLLIAYLAACDFGYISCRRMLTLINKTLNTVDKLSKWNGHLHNWYNTQTLDILPPAYISTVDSGNYIAYVMTLREGLCAMLGKALPDISCVNGILDTIAAAKLQTPDITLNVKALQQLAQSNEFSVEKLKIAIDELLTSDFSQPGDWIYKIREMAVSLKEEMELGGHDNSDIDKLIHSTVSRLDAIIDETSFLPLFDEHRQLFSIGYNIAEEKLTRSYYDLLASEARQTSFIAIAKGEVSAKHWFKLGRSLASDDGYRGLVSWTGTMFEYLMPLLLMKNYKNTLFDETYWFAVREQIKYAKKRTGEKHHSVWGISESGFYAFDLNLNYQYKALGTPILGLKRGLGSDTVITPYASVMALMVNPASAVDNIKKLQDIGMQDIYGFYEAIDFTKRRLAGAETHAIVKSYMVHHQGMSFVALCNVLNQNIMQKRFCEEPSIRSVDYLLCERVPTRVLLTNATKYDTALQKQGNNNVFYCARSFKNPHSSFPAAHILSNRNYSVVLTDSGCGYSKWNDKNITRWRPDLINPHYGSFVYVAQEGTNSWWSSTKMPCNDNNETCHALFSCDKAEFFRSDGQLDTHTQVAVSAQDNAEIRRVTITNHSQQEKIIALTSYQEILLTSGASDEAHPAFSNLFIRTEFEEKYNALLASRRPRTKDDPTLWAFHCVSVEGETVGQISYETDRYKFLGRNQNPSSPIAMRPGQPLENSKGAVLDPIFSIRCRIKVPVGGTACVNFVTGAAYSRDEVLAMSSKYSSSGSAQTAFELVQTRMRLENKYLALGDGQEEEILSMLPHLIYPSPLKEKFTHIMSNNRLSQQALWSHGISGDLPIMLLSITSVDHISMVERMLKAHEYYSLKGFVCDLVILCNQEASYTRRLFETVNEKISVSHARDMQNRAGGVFVRSTSNMSADETSLLFKVAKVVVISDDIRLISAIDTPLPNRNIIRTHNRYDNADIQLPPLEFFNSFGGFDMDANEYVIALKDGQSTPMPWCNVLANPVFGSVLSEAGGGYSWCHNSRENKLSPWTNDPVGDVAYENCYIKDIDTNEVFTVTSRPINENSCYVIRHGLGYTIYQHNSLGIEATQTVFVPPDEPIKIIELNLYNPSDTERHLSATYMLRPILGVGTDANRYVRSWCAGNTLCMENMYNSDFEGCVAFLSCSEPENSVTADAREFYTDTEGIPFALQNNMLSGRTGMGFDSVAAMQSVFSIPPKTEKKIVFVLGECENQDEVLKLAEKYRGTVATQYALSRTKAYWSELTGSIKVNTPDTSLDLMVNGWLLYQTISSRLFARSGFYQCGGAFGFRDQLQDVLSLSHHSPVLTRNQIIFHAAHQFKEGDVQHWWHMVKNANEGEDRGIRTKFSDDLLWLVYVTCQYINATQDYSILDETVPFIEGELLDGITDEKYSVPHLSNESATIYEHCLRALKRGLSLGEHGLVLMGSGDWNDGMSTVGNEGKGESVWLSWFVCDILAQFMPICRLKGDNELADGYEEYRKSLADSLDTHAWDGNWYKRAYFDDGTPLGSASNDECSIDAIAQAWSVISGVGNIARTKTAMDSLERHLVKRENGLIMLLTPPFDGGSLEPGYIKSYVPGVRENGGQYTHASAWVIMAYAMLGDSTRAWEYFNMINPINHGRTPIEIMQYKVEPYVFAADVYTNPQHTGRGGWTWYTGSSGWFYKVAVEELLGIKRKGDKLYIAPRIPATWPEFSVMYRFGAAKYHIIVKNPEGISQGSCEYLSKDCEYSDGFVLLKDDGAEHYITVLLKKE